MVDEEEGEKGKKKREEEEGEKENEEEGERGELKRSRLRLFLKSPSLLDSILIWVLFTAGHPHSRILRSLSGSKIL